MASTADTAAPRAALLVMDVQAGLVARFGEAAPGILDRVAAAVDAARGAGLPVVFVRVAFRPGYPEVSERNRGFSALARGTTPFTEDADATQVHPGTGIRDGDVVVVKRRVSAFAGSDLDVVLRALGADTLVLCGLVTSGVVLSTVRQAADMDYRLVVLSDACADTDQAVHDMLMATLLPRQAEVVSVAGWAAGLSGAEPRSSVPTKPPA